MKTKINSIKILKIIFVLVVFLAFFFSVKADLMALQGTVNPDAQDIRIYIYDSPTGGTLIYDSGTDFNNAIQNGRYDILLGSITPLTLEYGKLYYLDMSINGEDLDFNGSERQVFQSSVGKIKGNYINNSVISSIHILDGSISGIDIADDSIEKTKIQTTGQWQENEIPSLTASWTGTINASKLVSTNLLNVNSSLTSNTANNAITANTANNANSLQGYSATIFFSNDTMLYEKIENTNTTINIKKLGFNTTAELDNRYALIGSQSGSGNSSEEIQAVYYPTLSTYTNKTDVFGLLSSYSNTSLVYNLLSTYANSSTTITIANLYTTLSTYSNISQVYSLLSTYANTSDVLGISTLYNTLTTYWNKTEAYNTLSSYANQSWVLSQGYLTTETDSNAINKLSTYWNKSDGFNILSSYLNKSTLYDNILYAYANQSWVVNNFIQQGTKLGNSSQEIQAVYYPTLSTYINRTDTFNLLSTYFNATDQRYNDTTFISNVNRTENIKKLGFNITTELDTRYVQQGTKLGNSTQEIQAVYYPTLSTYINKSEADSLYQQKTNLRTLLYDDFTYWNVARYLGIGNCAALSSGTAASATVTDMYGAVSFSDSTTANGGYYCATNTAIMYFIGNETFTFRFRPNTNIANYIFDAGFEDSTTAADPTDGCWLKSTNLVVTGYCKNNAGPTGTASTYTLTSGTTYVGKIQVNPTATSVTFTIYDSTGQTQLWQDSVSANIPNTAGREFGVRIGAWQTTTSAAAVIVYWDWVKVEVPEYN
ncbi:MAG: hypothetical protein QW757_03590 [Candidatus Woesearchaeota archaeon]